jgi:hypothetical protein
MTSHLLLIVLFVQEDYAQKTGLAPAPLSISDELKKEVSNCLLLSRIQGKITTSIMNVISLISVVLMSDFPYYYQPFHFLIFEFVADVIMRI